MFYLFCVLPAVIKHGQGECVAAESWTLAVKRDGFRVSEAGRRLAGESKRSTMVPG